MRLELRTVEKIYYVADVLFVGQTFERFFREGNDGAQMLCELTE
jgi:hypothetical protein